MNESIEYYFSHAADIGSQLPLRVVLLFHICKAARHFFASQWLELAETLVTSASEPNFEFVKNPDSFYRRSIFQRIG